MDTLLLSQGVHLRNRLAVVPVGQVKPVDYFLILKLLRQYEEVPTKLLPIPKEVATPGRPLRALDWQTATLPCLIAPCSLSRESIGSVSNLLPAAHVGIPVVRYGICVQTRRI